jgi:DNA-binding beta-propeller fold protein YncE
VARLAGCFLATDRSGNVYVGDSCQQNTVVRKIAPSGKELARWKVDGLYGLAVDPAGNMYVTLGQGDEVDELSPSGHLLHVWGAGVKPGSFASPEGVVITPRGQVLVADSDNNRIQELSAGR